MLSNDIRLVVVRVGVAPCAREKRMAYTISAYANEDTQRYAETLSM